MPARPPAVPARPRDAGGRPSSLLAPAAVAAQPGAAAEHARHLAEIAALRPHTLAASGRGPLASANTTVMWRVGPEHLALPSGRGGSSTGGASWTWGSVAFIGQLGELLAEPLKHLRRRAAGPHAHPGPRAGLLRPEPPLVPALPPAAATRFWGSAQCPDPTVSAHRAAGVSDDAFRVKAGVLRLATDPMVGRDCGPEWSFQPPVFASSADGMGRSPAACSPRAGVSLCRPPAGQIHSSQRQPRPQRSGVHPTLGAGRPPPGVAWEMGEVVRLVSGAGLGIHAGWQALVVGD